MSQWSVSTCPILQQQGTRQPSGKRRYVRQNKISIFFKKWVGRETGKRNFFWCGHIKIFFLCSRKWKEYWDFFWSCALFSTNNAGNSFLWSRSANLCAWSTLSGAAKDDESSLKRGWESPLQQSASTECGIGGSHGSAGKSTVGRSISRSPSKRARLRRRSASSSVRFNPNRQSRRTRQARASETASVANLQSRCSRSKGLSWAWSSPGTRRLSWTRGPPGSWQLSWSKWLSPWRWSPWSFCFWSSSPFSTEPPCSAVATVAGLTPSVRAMASSSAILAATSTPHDALTAVPIKPTASTRTCGSQWSWNLSLPQCQCSRAPCDWRLSPVTWSTWISPTSLRTAIVATTRTATLWLSTIHVWWASTLMGQFQIYNTHLILQFSASKHSILKYLSHISFFFFSFILCCTAPVKWMVDIILFYWLCEFAPLQSTDSISCCALWSYTYHSEESPHSSTDAQCWH